MKFKLDENLPVELVTDLRALGHDADTVTGEGLRGAADPAVVDAALAADRILFTLDKGIANLQRYPIHQHAGVVSFRPDTSGRGAVIAFVRERLPASEGTAGRRIPAAIIRAANHLTHASLVELGQRGLLPRGATPDLDVLPMAEKRHWLVSMGIGAAVVGVLLQALWLYLQILQWKAHGDDYMGVALNVAVTVTLWSVLGFAIYRNRQDAKRSEATETKLENERYEHTTILASRDASIVTLQKQAGISERVKEHWMGCYSTANTEKEQLRHKLEEVSSELSTLKAKLKQGPVFEYQGVTAGGDYCLAVRGGTPRISRVAVSSQAMAL